MAQTLVNLKRNPSNRNLSLGAETQQQHFLTLSELTYSDASFALRMIKRGPSLGLTLVEISWAGGEAMGAE